MMGEPEAELTPPPPDGEAPPSYDSIDHVPNQFHNPRFEVGGEEEPPPPYSPAPGLSQHALGAPPDYYSLFGQIQEARQLSDNCFTFLRRVSVIILSTVGCTILLIVFMSIPITVLILGSIHVGQCEIEQNIPIFLIVGGISGILKNISLIFESLLKRCSDRVPTQTKKVKYAKCTWMILNLIFNLFMLAWIITGSYWIYHVYAEVNDSNFTNCNELLYKFAFGILTSSYILLTLMCCCTCACGLCLRRNRQQREEREGEEGDESGHGNSENSAGDRDDGSGSDDGRSSSEEGSPRIHRDIREYRTDQSEVVEEEESDRDVTGVNLRTLRWAEDLPPFELGMMSTGGAALEGTPSHVPPRHSAVLRDSNVDYFQLTEYTNSPILSPAHHQSQSHATASSESSTHQLTLTKSPPLPVPSPEMSHSQTLESKPPTLYMTQSSDGYSHTAV